MNQGFEHALVGDAQIDPLAEVEERPERPVFPAGGDDRIDGGFRCEDVVDGDLASFVPDTQAR